MSRRLLLGAFAREDELVAATAEARRRRFPVADVYTPYPIHGLDEAMGLKPTRLGIFCLLAGLTGVCIAVVMQSWTHAVSWPLNVGGRPFNAWPAYVPVAFEMMVLLAGTGTVLAFLVVARLYPGKGANSLDLRSTDDRFLLVIEAAGEASDTDAVLELYRSHGAQVAEEREVAPPVRSAGRGHWVLNGVLALALVLVVAGICLLRGSPGAPNMEFLPDMASPVAYPSFAPHPDLPGGKAMQAPQPGTIARGQLPIHYANTPQDAERAGKELANPLPADDAARLQRGAFVYSQFCVVCHGPGGNGDGPVTRRGVPPPPSLLDPKAIKLAPGQLFHILTYGQNNMASYASQISPEDRWAVILHLMKMQKR